MGTMRIVGDKQVTWTETELGKVGPESDWTRPVCTDLDTIHLSATTGDPAGDGTAADPVDTLAGALALCVSGGLSKILIMDSATYTERIDNEDLLAVTIIADEDCEPELVQPDAEVVAFGTVAGNPDFDFAGVDQNGQIQAGGAGISGTYYWTGSSWGQFDIPDGGSGAMTCRPVMHDGQLYVGYADSGSYGLARFNGTTWAHVADAPATGTARITALCSHDGQLFVGTDDADSDVAQRGLYVWNGLDLSPVGPAERSANSIRPAASAGHFAGFLVPTADGASDTRVRGIWYAVLQAGGYYVPQLLLRWDDAQGVALAGGYVWAWGYGSSRIVRGLPGGTRWQDVAELSGVKDIFSAAGEVYALTATALYLWTGSGWSAVTGSGTALNAAAVGDDRVWLVGENGEVKAVYLAHVALDLSVYGGGLFGWGFLAVGRDMAYSWPDVSGYYKAQAGGEMIGAGAVFHDCGALEIEDALAMDYCLLYRVSGGVTLSGASADLSVQRTTIAACDRGLEVLAAALASATVSRCIFDTGLDVRSAVPLTVQYSRVRVSSGPVTLSGCFSDLPHFQGAADDDYRPCSLAAGFKYDSPAVNVAGEGDDAGCYRYTRAVSAVVFGVDYLCAADPDTVTEQLKLPGAGGSEGVDGSFFAWAGSEREARAREWRWSEDNVVDVAQVKALRALWASCRPYLVGIAAGDGWLITGPTWSRTGAYTDEGNGKTGLTLTITAGTVIELDEYVGELLLIGDAGAYRITGNDGCLIAGGTIEVIVHDPGGVLRLSGDLGPCSVLSGLQDPRLYRFDPRQAVDMAGPAGGLWTLQSADHRGGVRLVGREVWIDA